MPHSDTRITLGVGGRLFNTSFDTLVQADYFKDRFSNGWQPSEDGSFFVDADPEMFEHVLSYLRHLTPPLFFDGRSGHMHCMYVKLSFVARYFGVLGLVEYLENRKYLQLIRISYETEIMSQAKGVKYLPKSDEMVDFIAICGVKAIHVCRAGRDEHRGKPEKCFRKKCCTPGNAMDVFAEEVALRMVRASRRVVIDHHIGTA
ncbi:MAG: hypothetical protein Q9160_004478 [Pyrenula sp. 1 TL-2023]